ncbi:MAG: sugar isomerase, partial [Geminicoccaceae bacterium]|nr:sugar isomerase [Geminicoccaceae bacterium]
LDAGSINPFQLFLVFHELVLAGERRADGFEPAYMIDQSHNVTDPVESLMDSAMAIQRAHAQALLVDRHELGSAQDANDAIGARDILMRAFRCDVSPLIAEARLRSGGALDPIRTFRATGYRQKKDAERPQQASFGGGIV